MLELSFSTLFMFFEFIEDAILTSTDKLIYGYCTQSCEGEVSSYKFLLCRYHSPTG